MLEDIKAITELEPNGIIHIAVLFSFFTNCVNTIIRWCSLTRTSASCTKNAYLQAKLQNQYKFTFREISNYFSFFCFVLQRTSNVHFWYIDLTLIVAHEYVHAKQKTITRNIRNRDNKNCPNCTVALSTRYKVNSAEEQGWDASAPRRVR